MYGVLRCLAGAGGLRGQMMYRCYSDPLWGGTDADRAGKSILVMLLTLLLSAAIVVLM